MNMQADWVHVCALADITPNTGVCVTVKQQAIALFRVAQELRVYALSNLDPFSGSHIMSRGIIGDLQGERVVAAPMYKQHFSLATGRCLEHPEQHLAVFATQILDGEVWLNPIPQKTYLPQPMRSTEKLKLLLVGNGLAGMRCLEDLLDMSPERYEISVIGEEAYGNYNRILLSPVLAGDQDFASIMLHPPQWYRDKNITFIANDRAIRLDRARKQVHTQSGQVVDYDRLILATGSQPFIPKLAGCTLSGVVSFRNIEDVEKMLTSSQTQQQAVVIGGGVLGLEAAYGLSKRGMQVTVLHLGEYLMDRQLDAQASRMLQDNLEARGIQIITQAQTEKITGDTHVQAVHLTDGREIAADLVVFAAGIRPNIELAQTAGLRCERGILVNDTMQTFDPSIYAVGECTQHRGQTFGLVEPLWGQAFICASHLAEHGSLSFKAPQIATQLKVSGCDVFSAGNLQPQGEYEEILLEDAARKIYKRLLLQHGCLIGAVLFGDTQDGAWYAELIQEQQPLAYLRHKLLFGRDFALKHAG